MKKILEVKDLGIGIKSKNREWQAVEGVDLDLYEGESIGIVGESGCGKTMTMMAILKLLLKYRIF